MSERKKMLSIEYHYDGDTGMYHVVEIDFGISGNLDEYLKSFGREGKNEIIQTLSYLMYVVETKFREQDPKERADTQ